MKVIGLVGEKGSGKQTFVNFLKEILKQVQDDESKIATGRTKWYIPRNDKGEILDIRQVRFSDILAETLIIWDLPISRVNLQKLAIMMNATFGETALANAAKFSIEGDSADIVVFDGIRREAEFKLVKGMKNHLLIYITADQNLRYMRLKERSEKVGEIGLTYEQFLAEEQSKAEINIPALGEKADKKIENNGSLQEFKARIEELIKL